MMNDRPEQDKSRRKAPRMRVSLRAGVMVQEKLAPQPQHLTIDNISVGGMFVLAPVDMFDVGTILKIRLELKERVGPDGETGQVQCEGRIIHQIHPRGFGVEILSMSDSDKQKYYDAIEEYAKDPARVIPI